MGGKKPKKSGKAAETAGSQTGAADSTEGRKTKQLSIASFVSEKKTKSGLATVNDENKVTGAATSFASGKKTESGLSTVNDEDRTTGAATPGVQGKDTVGIRGG